MDDDKKPDQTEETSSQNDSAETDALSQAAEAASEQVQKREEETEEGGEQEPQISEAEKVRRNAELSAQMSSEDYLEKGTQNVDQEKDIDSEIPVDVRIVPENALAVLNLSQTEMNKITGLLPKVKLPNTEENRIWAMDVQKAVGSYMTGNAFAGSLTREGSEWGQVVEEEGVRMAMSRPQLGKKPGQEGEALTGQRGINRILGVLGLGSMMEVPLWHSGLWVSLKAPTDSELLMLDETLAQEKIRLGQQTAGLVFSNTSVYINNHLINFVLDHVYDVTAKDSSSDNLRKLIRSTDIPTLIWAMACTIYPKGFPYSRPCVSNPVECTHVAQAMLNLGRLFWVDRGAIDQASRRFMINRRAKHENEAILNYQENLLTNNKRKVQLSDDISVIYKVPNLDEYVQSGFEWIESIVEMVEQNFGTDLKGQERQEHIYAQGELTRVRQYSHWVDRIILHDDGSGEPDYVEDRETLLDTLSAISGADSVSEKFFEEIQKFIDGATVCLVAIPRYKCPKCGRPQGHDEQHKFLIPLDVANVFFTLQRQKISRVVS